MTPCRKVEDPFPFAGMDHILSFYVSLNSKFTMFTPLQTQESSNTMGKAQHQQTLHIPTNFYIIFLLYYYLNVYLNNILNVIFFRIFVFNVN
jgi:hypothetical protein